ncbi:LLM class flavin-dependent oxidoreductase [Nocardia goodfellowii]|uniref:Alkanesulfonate monooxygenase SsuD/methylene tetrahydromethanopterin reductase-like flavin-dependent oxidoreductase (Luciferase family) n=1 Tax=Nocardia goodfellowii TaxID=882446 RepID=A0ABS4QEL2_9NOCA|nr:LLM class flavin-dependent oxidoreductase [Nocardia goodfellowii]MBP2190147.1 alkanesulfonate monooxygenase SsuD/methylene tetrahydromethanopterin reductase-like flavin-dependent oxidoreductase (luciferase family) [Nocardia goodfellowii]
MKIGVALPQMAPGYGPGTTLDWARRIDAGPFSSVSVGERVTFSNPEMVATLGACAAVTERVRVLANLWVLPQHPMAMVAQQIGTLDQLANGRLEVAVGVGGREHDYRALGADFKGRHQQLDDKVAELKSLLAGKPPFEGADPVGPPCVRPGGPIILAGAMGPKAMRRAARWADGISGFSIPGAAEQIAEVNELAERCWAEAGRTTTPRKVSGCFTALGGTDAPAALRSFTARYLGFLGPRTAEAVAASARASSPEVLAEILDGAERAGCDEFILVPAVTDLNFLEVATEVVAARP